MLDGGKDLNRVTGNGCLLLNFCPLSLFLSFSSILFSYSMDVPTPVGVTARRTAPDASHFVWAGWTLQWRCIQLEYRNDESTSRIHA
ncbi:hypothetical protein KQX54_005907 [Cotesia glomerata]|uniref:FHA domain-containing protein n=1 Tax=Cotesia glomerata TaxID=32391 RepID=A0AAV7HZH6_COTGL|nr:hypothetical protein KQX54_005907 [Cotesia glomerata]